MLDREGAEYTIEKIAAKTGKAASFIAKRLKGQAWIITESDRTVTTLLLPEEY